MPARYCEADGWMEELNDEAAAEADTFTILPNSKIRVCNYCGTSHDTSAVDLSDYVPMVGDGCEHCNPDPRSGDAPLFADEWGEHGR